jgi:hypothetical protein
VEWILFVPSYTNTRFGIHIPPLLHGHDKSSYSKGPHVYVFLTVITSVILFHSHYFHLLWFDVSMVSFSPPEDFSLECARLAS